MGITYQPGVRPGIVILPAPGLDSVKAIVERDLDYSDRFEVIALAQVAPSAGTGAKQPLNYAFYRTLGAGFAIELGPAPGSATVLRIHDLAAERVRNELLVTLGDTRVEPEPVLEAGAPAALDRDAENERL